MNNLSTKVLYLNHINRSWEQNLKKYSNQSQLEKITNLNQLHITLAISMINKILMHLN